MSKRELLREAAAEFLLAGTFTLVTSSLLVEAGYDVESLKEDFTHNPRYMPII